MSEPVAGAKVELGVGSEGVTAGVDKALRAFTKFQRDVQATLDKIQGSKPTLELQKMEQALQKAGGVTKLTDIQFQNLAKSIERAVAAGGKLPAALRGIKAPTIAMPSLDMSKLGGALQGAGQAQLGQFASSAGPLGGVLTALGPAGLAAAAGVGALTAAVAASSAIIQSSIKSLVDYGSKITDISASSDLSVGFLQELDNAASLVGGNFETVADAAGTLTKKIGEGNAVFERLGFTFEQLRAMSPDERFLAVGQAILSIEEPTRRAAIGAEVFGLKWGAAETTIRAAISGAAGDMPKLSDAAIKAADDLGDQITRMEKAWESLKMQFGAKFVEGGGLTTFITGLTAEINNLASAISNNKAVIGGFFKTLDSVFMGGGGNAIIEQLQKTGAAAQKFEEMRTRRAGEVAAATEFAHEALGGGHQVQTEAEVRKAAEAARKFAEENRKANELSDRLQQHWEAIQKVIERINEHGKGQMGEFFKAQERQASGPGGLGQKLLAGLDEEARINAQMVHGEEAHRLALKAQDDLLDSIIQKERERVDAILDGVNAAGEMVTDLGRIGNILEMLGAKSDSKGMKIIGDLQQEAAGAQELLQGMATGNVVQMAEGAIKGVLGQVHLFQHLLGKKTEAEKIADDLGKAFGVEFSDSVIKAIENTMKSEDLSRGFAELLHVDDLIDESGLDPSKFSGMINSLMEAVALGSVPAKEGLEELGDAFADLKEAAEGGSLASEAAMVQMIRRSRELGEAIPGIDAALQEFLDQAVAGFERFIANIMPVGTKTFGGADAGVSEAQAAANQQIFGVLFEAEVAQLGVVDAAERMSKAFNDLIASLPSGTVLTGPLARAAHVIDLLEQDDGIFKAAAEAAAGLADTLEGLVKSDNLSQNTVDAVGTSVQTIFDQALSAEGATRDDAMQAILPLLNELAKAQALGADLDPKTAALLAEAQASGLVPLQEPIVQLVGLQRQSRDLLAKIAGVEVPGVPGSGGGSDSGGGADGTPVGSDKGMAGGGVSTGPMSGHWEKLHGTEMVVPLNGGAGGAAGMLRSLGVGNNFDVYSSPQIGALYLGDRSRDDAVDMITEAVQRGDRGLRTAILRALEGKT